MSSPSKGKNAKRTQKYDARELWAPSPSPVEDWGSDADLPFEMEVVSEEIGYNGNSKFEVSTSLPAASAFSNPWQVKWKGWRRRDGTNTTWENKDLPSDHPFPPPEWTSKLDEAAKTPDIELWGTTDIANTRTRENKQGFKQPDEHELAVFRDRECAKMVRRMETLMADKKAKFPELWSQESTTRSGATRAVPPPPPLPHRNQVNAAAGPSRIHVNAEAGPSRLRSPVSKSRTPVALPNASSSATTSKPRTSAQPSASSSRPPAPIAKPRTSATLPSASSSRLPPPLPSIPIPPPRCGSPAISVSSSAGSIEYLGSHIIVDPKPLPAASGVKRKAVSPTSTAPPLPKRRALPARESLSNAESTPDSKPRRSPNAPLGWSPSSKLTSATSQDTPRQNATTSRVSTPTRPSVSMAASKSASRREFPLVSAGPSTRASTSATPTRGTSGGHALPERSRKRKAPDDVSGRTCPCGTLLPPPDVWRMEVCDTCRNEETRNRYNRAIRHSRPPAPSPEASTVRSDSVSSVQPERPSGRTGTVVVSRPLPLLAPPRPSVPNGSKTESCSKEPGSTSASRSRRAWTSAAETQRSHALPQRPPKPKAPGGGVSPRFCICGSLLPPSSIHHLDVCALCHEDETRKRWEQAKVADDRLSSSSSSSRTLVQSPGVSTIRSSSISSVHQEQRDGTVGKSAVVVPRAPSLSVNSARKGKARESVKSLRLQTESSWSELAANCNGTEPGAAGITFVNDIDDEEIPKSLHGGAFQYLEDKYFPSPTLPFPVDPDENAAAPFVADPTSFQFCDPECECEDVRHCCQDTEYVNGYAYTDGLFNFEYMSNQVVVECNPYCLCPPTCGNRVTQQPRRMPIEVFKTARCGWGVRLPVDIVRGTVLGVYTGKLIPRKEAESLTGEAKQYCFDLDYDEEGAAEDELYTVDSRDYGNWTRFINHSCAPNLLVQPVVHDTLPAQRIAFLTFIATKDISSGTELTFDYDPEAQIKFVNDVRERGEARARNPSRRPPGANECMCGAERCRGWTRT